MKEKMPILIAILTFTVIGGIHVYDKVQYKRQIKELTSIQPQSVISFKVYPKVGRPVGSPVEFNDSTTMITDFFDSLTDVESYSPSHDTAKEEEGWFLEIFARGISAQIRCYIPTKKRDTVTGHFDPSGSFQSRKLYHWYQKYSHRWLEPEASQPTPTPQPDPPGGE